MRVPLLLAALSLATPAAADLFQTPSGNIQCYGDADVVDCELIESDVAPPLPRPLDCDLEWGARFGVGAAGRGFMLCYGDTVRGQGYPILPYGQSVSFGAITCFSSEGGLQCLNRDGGGFQVSRGLQRLF